MTVAAQAPPPVRPRQRAKRLLSEIGIDSIDRFWKPLALRLHRRKLAADTDYRQWCESAGWSAITAHWGEHDLVEDEFVRLHVASQLFEVTELLRRRIGPVEERSVLDAGASDGLFLQRIEAENAVGINLLQECVDKVAAAGYRAVLADIEQLPFEDRAFDIVLCCETLEHVPNPVATLNELARVCRGRIHLTIPWLRRTRISPRPAGWPMVEGHIFEFAPADFSRILSHADVRLVDKGFVQVFPEPRNPLLQAWLSVLMYPNFFPRLQYYELEPAR